MTIAPHAAPMPEVKDPVCGMAFDEETAADLGATAVEHEGRRYWFCCPTCEKEFRAAPQRFSA